MNVSIEEKILTGLFLCSDKSIEILAALKPEWNDKCSLSLSEKLLIINYSLLIPNIFPWKEELSTDIDYEELCKSFLIQPDLFIRIRPGYAEKVLLKLNELKVQFEFISPFAIRLPNSFKADQYFELDKEVVVQDYSSQRLALFLPADHGKQLLLWDCCAGSGGKSIMAYDVYPEVEFTVSDLRENILANLKKRFESAGIKKYNSLIHDLSKENIFRIDSSFGKYSVINNKFSIIIADVPCTGSGTWSRTPEQLYFFDEKKIEEYAKLQRKIVSNAIPLLQPGGTFIYITCSVFKKENEEVAVFIKESFHLQLKQMEVLKGYDKKADSMFVAVFENQL